MGRDLLGEPAFRAAFEECDRALRTFTGWSVTEELLADRATSRLGRSDVDQPVLFALQTALARTLSVWGVEPGVVFGQSVGEMAAAVFAGALPLDEGARLITTWSRLVTECAAGHGALTVCELSVEDAESLPGVRAGQLSLVGHLAPGQVCLSGPREAVGALERDLDGLGVRAVRVNIDHAAHSARLAALAPELQRRLGVLRTRATTVPFWSTATGGYADGTDLDAAYWARSMCTPMRLAEAIRALADRRGLRVVEITPHPVASHSLRRGLDAVGAGQPSILSTGRRGRGARQALEDVAAALWCDGSDVDWGAVTGRRQRRAAPVPVVLTVSGRTARARAENAARLAGRLDGTPDAGLPTWRTPPPATAPTWSTVRASSPRRPRRRPRPCAPSRPAAPTPASSSGPWPRARNSRCCSPVKVINASVWDGSCTRRFRSSGGRWTRCVARWIRGCGCRWRRCCSRPTKVPTRR
jgi:acyl transferase domain-containing protein